MRLRILFALFAVSIATSLRADTIRVAAAISLKDALAEVAKAHEAATGDTVEFVLGASGQLATQIKSGAAVDVFLSAAAQQMDDLAKDKLIDPATRRNVVGNTLVLVVPADNATVTSFDDLARPAVEKFAVGEPKTVPAGTYAAETLKALKLTDAVAAKLVYGTNVRQVLSYVERGEVQAGLVYATDAKQSGEKVRVVATAPAESHAPIVYPAAIVTATAHRVAAERFLAQLTAIEAQQTFARYGFTAAPQSK